MGDVISQTGLSRSAIYQKIACNQFPKQVPLGARAVGWLLDEVNGWVEHQVKVSRAG
ncbi:MAG: AlpA family phage regulatory protein [Bryobacterales bacterium]|nr:AlpA family phage regulatory protein [Bryobacterales bacterium]